MKKKKKEMETRLKEKIYKCPRNFWKDIQGGRRNIQGQEEEQAYKGILREARENQEKTKNQWEDGISKEKSCQKC